MKTIIRNLEITIFREVAVPAARDQKPECPQKRGGVYIPNQLFADKMGKFLVSHLLKGLLQLELTVKNIVRKNIARHGKGRSFFR